MEKIKYFCISVDGMPFTGKTTVCKYLKKFSKKYMIVDNGIVNSATTAALENNIEYDYSQFKGIVVAYLIAVKEDINARGNDFATSKDYNSIVTAMNKMAQAINDNGVKVLVYNTTKYTPYLIAKDIIMQVDQLNSQVQQQQNDATLSAQNNNQTTEGK